MSIAVNTIIHDIIIRIQQFKLGSDSFFKCDD